MEKTYIISDGALINSIAEKLNISCVSYQAHENEQGFHNWLTREFREKDIQRIIIPLTLQSNETDGLLIGLHIRLNYELPIEKRIIPIVFLSNYSLENILTKCTFDEDNNPQNLLLTDGVSISSTDLDEIKEKIETTSALEVKDYSSFLNKMNIKRKSFLGHHDIANAWGCYKLGQVVGFKSKSLINHEKLAQLYAKWLICQNEATKDSGKEFIYLNPIECYNKKILFIDDKSDEGWGDLMHHIFNKAGNGFTCVDVSRYKNENKTGFTDFDGYITECKTYIGDHWDLIIIDLRLNPEEEDIDANNSLPKDFSGYKLIDEFLENNGGYQIMVSTASNKIWNVDKALKRGAKGYYIKESPEFNYPISETKKRFDDFKTDVEKCFEDAYLQDVYSSIEKIKENLPKDDFGNTIGNQLDLAFYLVSKARTDEQYAFAYVSLYLVIELINKEYLMQDANNDWVFKSNENETLNAWSCVNKKLLGFSYKKDKLGNIIIDNNGNAEIISVAHGNDATEWQKIVGVIKQLLKTTISDGELVDLNNRIRSRNWFIHGDVKLQDCFNKIIKKPCKDCLFCIDLITNKYKEDQRKEQRNLGNCVFCHKKEREIYTKEGFIKLFEIIQSICLCLQSFDN